jgi:very-short-patch-repair endonuclease
MTKQVLPYNRNLKKPARYLRKKMTDSEQMLWYRLRRKQLLGVQFYRQKPIGNYIVDFFAPKTNLVVEIDGYQHMEEYNAKKDKERDAYLSGLGIRVLRFNSRAVLKDIDAVVESIYRVMEKNSGQENPPKSHFNKGGHKISPLLSASVFGGLKRGVRGDFEIKDISYKNHYVRRNFELIICPEHATLIA